MRIPVDREQRGRVAVGGTTAMKTRLLTKPLYKQVLPDPQCSWRFAEHQFEQIPFQLHYHSAYELALTCDSRGLRYVGDSVEPYHDADLVLTGPNLPHSWCSDPAWQGRTQRVQVLQLPAGWLEQLADTLPELQPVRSLLQAATRGLHFSSATTRAIADLFAELPATDPFDQFVTLVQVLRCLKADSAARVLASAPTSVTAIRDSGMGRIEKVMEYIHRHYTEDLRAEQLAKYAHMSTNHFHRFIKQRTDKTFNELVTELRVGKACQLLLNSSMQIASICSQCGFNDLSNFNRRFMQLKHCTPSEFRRLALQQNVNSRPGRPPVVMSNVAMG